MKMLNLVCKKDFYMEPNYEGAPVELSYKAGKNYTFLKIGNKYIGFDESQHTKHTLLQECIDKHFFKEKLGEFDIIDDIASELRRL